MSSSKQDLSARLDVLSERFGSQIYFENANKSKKSDDHDKGKWVLEHMEPAPLANGSSQDTMWDWEAAAAPVVEEKPGIEEEEAFRSLGLATGEMGPEELEYVPWKIVRGYPMNFVGNTNRPCVKDFFDCIYEEQPWDFFYLYNPLNKQTQPRLLVPSIQFRYFLQHVNKELDLHLSIPRGGSRDRFYMRYGQGGTPRPRYLQRTEKQGLEFGGWPSMLELDVQSFRSATEAGRQKFKVQWSQMLMGRDQDKKKAAEERAKRKASSRINMLRDVQGLLGLGEHPPKEDAVFICIDVEALELSPHPISEVGVAVLELKDLVGKSPGDAAQGWWHLIRCTHLRTMEYVGQRNYRFVQGCPDNFDFGTSLIVPKADLAKALDDVVAPYLASERDIFLVGHDLGSDVKFLSDIGYDIRTWKTLRGEFDSQKVHSAWCESSQGRSLKTVLGDLGIRYKHLHNAGNDAMFTMRALVGVAVKDMSE